MGLDRTTFKFLFTPAAHDDGVDRGKCSDDFFYIFCLANETTLALGNSVNGSEI
jgi:hypothetical protein